jgi:hypothetical protein
MSHRFHEQVLAAVAELRRRLAPHEAENRFHLEILCTGRVRGGLIEITYKLSRGSYEPQTKGNLLEPVITEFIRREGWDSVHAPLMLEPPEAPEAIEPAPDEPAF